MVKKPPANAEDAGDLGFEPWVGKIPWRRKWHPMPGFLPGKCHGQRSLAGYSPWNHSRTSEHRDVWYLPITNNQRKQQIANIHWIIEKAREFQKNIVFCFIDYAKAFDCVDHNKLWKILKEMGIPGHLTCLLRNLYAGQEAIVRTGHGTTDWFQIGKGVRQGCILSPCLFNLYAEYIMRNAGLEETQAGIKISGRNINILRYADDTTLMAESKEELKSLLMKVKEEIEKAGLKLNVQKMKIMTSSPITLW